MKNKLYGLLLLCFTFSGMLKPQELYYWSDGKKHFLEEDKKAIVISVKEGENIDALIRDFQSKMSVQATNISRDRLRVIIKTNEVMPDLETMKKFNPSIKTVA